MVGSNWRDQIGWNKLTMGSNRRDQMTNGIKSEVGSNKLWEQKGQDQILLGIKNILVSKGMGSKRPGPKKHWDPKGQDQILLGIKKVLVSKGMGSNRRYQKSWDQIGGIKL